MKTVILRHRKENLKKCSLTGLEKRSDLIFYTYPTDPLPTDYSNYLLLSLGADVLTQKDQHRGLFLIDASWKLAKTIQLQLPYPLETRSLPSHFQTAYPRKQTNCPDPTHGLASIEALYIAHLILGRDVQNLLDHYYFKKTFLKKNYFNNLQSGFFACE